MLFSDIRGFTALSETMNPDDMATLLTEYFTEMVECVFRHGGTLDKFIGDAVMAQWGAPLGNPDDADRAMQAAIDMMTELDALNARWREQGRPTLRDRHRAQSRRGVRRQHRLRAPTGVHRHRRHREHGEPALLRRGRRRDPHLRRDARGADVAADSSTSARRWSSRARASRCRSTACSSDDAARSPPGYLRVTVGRCTAVARAELEDDARALLADGPLYAAAARDLAARPLAGRGIAYAVALPVTGARAVVRHNRHGGLLRAA